MTLLIQIKKKEFFWKRALLIEMSDPQTLFLTEIGPVICNIAIYADDTTLYCEWDQAPDIWQRLELASELESDLLDTGLRQEMAC